MTHNDTQWHRAGVPLAYIFILLPSILEVPYCVHWTKTVYHECKKLKTLYYVQYVFLIKGTVQRDGSGRN